MCFMHPTIAARSPDSQLETTAIVEQANGAPISRLSKIPKLWLAGQPVDNDLAAASRDPFAICLSGGSTREGSTSCSPKPRIAMFFHGTASTGSGVTSASSRGTTRTAIMGWCTPRCSGERRFRPTNIHGIPTNGAPAEAAAAYERMLKSY